MSVFISFSGLNPLQALERYTIECDSALWFRSLDSGIAQEGTLERGQNAGPVMKYLNPFHAPAGTAYCLYGWQWSFLVAAQALHKPVTEIPFPRTGLVRAVWNDAKRKGIRTRADPIRGDFVLWHVPKTVKGHIERVKQKLKGGIVKTTAFNTTDPSKAGSQRDGGGVFEVTRPYLHPLGRMGCLGFIGRRNKGQAG